MLQTMTSSASVSDADLELAASVLTYTAPIEPISLSLPLNAEDGADTLADVIGDEGAGAARIERDVEMSLVVAELPALDVRARVVIALRYGVGAGDWTLGEIGGVLGLTGESVRQIERRALRALREVLS